MKMSWGVYSLVLGVAVGLIIAESGDSAMNKASHSVKGKQLEDYWNQTEINLESLKKIVNNDSCRTDSNQYLACINSMVNGLKSTKFHLEANGDISANDEESMREQGQSEKQTLETLKEIKDIDFEKMWDEIVKITPEKQQKVAIAAGINGYLSVARDPHTYISPTDYFKEVGVANERSPYFLGLSFKKKDGNTYIKKVYTKSDADYAGLESRDEVLSINGKDMTGCSLAEISQILRDKSQQSFSFLVKRDGATYVKKIVRSYRILSHVNVDLIGKRKNVGYIQLTKFARNVCDDVEGRLEWLKMNNVSGVVLDLRDNPGGLLSEASCLMGLFIGSEKRAFSVRYLNSISDEEVTYTSREQVYSGPLVILTNNASASASELLAGALQEYQRAIVMGQRTFGKGTFQEVETWGQSKAISFFETKGFYLLPSGMSPQLTGIKPNITTASLDEEVSEEKLYHNPIYPDRWLKSKSKVASHNLDNATGISQ